MRIRVEGAQVLRPTAGPGGLAAKSRSPLTSRRTRELAARRSEEIADVSTAYGHCPRCGQESFSQRRLWVQSKDVYLGTERY